MKVPESVLKTVTMNSVFPHASLSHAVEVLTSPSCCDAHNLKETIKECRLTQQSILLQSKALKEKLSKDEITNRSFPGD